MYKRQIPIFVQERVGRNGKHFKLYKLRSVAPGAPSVATHNLSLKDITKTGKIIRRLKIDELPQLYNVLTGSMTLVGPRPSLTNQSSLIENRMNRGVLTVLPGITGLSQIRKLDMSDEDRLVNSDTEYLEIKSVAVDLKIIYMTIKGDGFGDHTLLDK